jgi:hypothetical protein
MIEFLEIDRKGCMRMLAAASGRIGRIAVGGPGSAPTVRPVNYAFDDRTESVVFRSALGSKLQEGWWGGGGWLGFVKRSFRTRAQSARNAAAASDAPGDGAAASAHKLRPSIAALRQQETS